MVRKWEAMFYLRKVFRIGAIAVSVMIPGLALADTIVTTKSYVDDYAVAQNQGTGSNNANVGKTLVVNSSGVLELSTVTGMPSGTANQIVQHNGTNWTATSLGSTLDTSNGSYNASKLVTAGTIASALAAKVDVMQGVANKYKNLYVNASGSVALQYAQIPVSTGDPNNGGTLDTTNPLASIWLQ